LAEVSAADKSETRDKRKAITPDCRENSMHFRTILSGTLALMLLAGAAAAEDRGILGLPKLFGGKDKADVQLAQNGDPRITALEEQVRTLSGRVEELNFQILQMQDQMRKMQEDNEFRFQELEGKKSDASGKGNKTLPAPAGDASQAAEAAPAPAPVPPQEVIVENGGEAPAAPGVPPKTFGTITFDKGGNVTAGSVGDQVTETAPGGNAAPAGNAAEAPPAGADNTVVAALPATNDPEELYRNSYEFILSGDYGTAESGFRDHIERFPADPRTADSRYWLGEAQLGQKKYRDAAETFLAANKEYPSAKKAPDMLLKLGVSLVGLDQHDVACATFSEIGKRYPDVSGALKDRVKQEQALAKC
jgi:tol-pal system protein YbgF